MHSEAQKQHQWLQQLIGQWTYHGEVTMEPGKPPEIFAGLERVRALGELWVLAEGQGEMPCGGDAATMLSSIGFDPHKKRFVGVWMGSMATQLWVYEGELDASERVLTLHAQGPDMLVPEKTASYQDVMEIVSDDHRVLNSHILGADGQWHGVMTAHYQRSR